MPAKPTEENQDLPPGVPRPPSKAEIDIISKDQALITDEWAPAPAHPAKPGEKDTDAAHGS